MRTRGFPDEQITTKRYEILLRFTHGVCDPILRQELAVVKAAESYLADPPTVESLGFTTRQLQRYRPLPGKTYDPRYAMRSRPHPLMPRKIIHPEPRMPQNVLPYPQMQQYMKPVVPKPSTPSVKQIPLQPMQAPQGNCFNCGQPSHLARECPSEDQARKPEIPIAQDDQVKYCEETLVRMYGPTILCQLRLDRAFRFAMPKYGNTRGFGL